jgi:hypothetical protein
MKAARIGVGLGATLMLTTRNNEIEHGTTDRLFEILVAVEPNTSDRPPADCAGVRS